MGSNTSSDMTGERQNEPRTTSTRRVLTFIETTFDKVLKDIQERPCGQPAVTIRRITKAIPFDDLESNELQWDIEDREVTYGWPGKNRDEAWRFACIIQILSEIQHAVKAGTIITKRDLYYREPELFKKQETVDRYLDDIAHTCQVSRSDLNVVASPKGLVAGLQPNREVSLIPAQTGTIDEIALSHVKWIAVIEKEASFNELVEKKLHNNTTLGPGLLVTGKGYPDLLTRQFLRFVLDKSARRLPVFGVFDGDPDGIAILKCYRRGSTSLGHEHAFNIPEMQWLGIKLSEAMQFLAPDGPLLHLTARDESCIRGLLRTLAEDRNMSDAIDELKRMLMMRYKVELQVLVDVQGGFAGWVERSLSKNLELL